MFVKALKTFKDKRTGELVRPGDVINVEKKRGNDIIKRKLGEEYTQEPQVKAPVEE